MSDQVDKRIVEMEFDNAQFKKGVSETIESIKNLDNSLEFKNGAKGLEGVASAVKKVDVSGLAEGAAEVEMKFKGLQSTGVAAINAIGSVMKGGLISGGIISAIGALPVVAKSISGGIGRAQKLAKAKFQMEGLGIAAEEVEAIMARVNKSVDGTAYGLDDAAVAASSLKASGVDDLDRLEVTLRSIAGMAAMTGTEYSAMSDIMTKVAGKGKVQGEELNQLAHHGLNAAAAIAQFLQTEEGMAKYGEVIEKFGNDEAAVREMASKGALTFDMFSDGMVQFSSMAERANETFEGSLANIGAALNRTTADFFGLVMGLNGLVPIFNEVRGLINNINKATNMLMHTWTDSNGVERIGVVTEGVLAILSEIGSALYEINAEGLNESGLSGTARRWREQFEMLAPLIDGVLKFIAAGARSMVKSIYTVFTIVRELMTNLIMAIYPIGQAFKEVFGPDAFSNLMDGLLHALETIRNVIRSLRPTRAMLDNIRGAFTFVFQVASRVANLFGGVLTVGFEMFLTVLQLAYGAASLFAEVISTLFYAVEPLLDIVAELVSAFLGFSDEAGEGIIGFFKELREHVTDMTKHIREFLKPLREFAENVRTSLKEALDNGGKDTILSWFAGGRIGFLVHAAAYAFSHFGTVLQAVGEFLQPVAKAIGTTLVGGFMALSDIIGNSGIVDFFSNLAGNAASFLGIGKAFADTGEGGEQAAEGMDEFAQRFGEAAAAARDGAIEFGGHLLDALVAIGTTVWNVVSPALTWLGNLAMQVATAVGEAWSESNLSFEPVLDFFSEVGELISDFFSLFEDGMPTLEDFGELFGGIGEAFGAMTGEIGPQLSTFFSNLGSELSEHEDGPIGDVIGLIGVLAENLGKLPDLISNIPSGVGGFFESIFNGIAGMIRNPFAVEKTWADDGSGGVNEALDAVHEESFNLAQAITEITKVLKDPVTNAHDFFKDTVQGALKGIGEAINAGISSIDLNAISIFIEAAKDVVVGFSALWGTISLVSVFESIREVSLEISEWARGITAFINNWAAVPAAINGVFGALKEGIDNITKAVASDIKANKFLKYCAGFALSIGVLAGALFLISRIDEKDIWRSVGVLGAIVTMILVYQLVMALISKVSGSGEVAGLAGLAGMGLAIGMIARAMNQIGQMKPEELERALPAVLGLIVMLGVMATMVGSISKFGVQGAVVIMAIAVALKMLASIIGMYANITDSDMVNGGIRVIAVLGALALAAVAIGKFSGEFYKAGAALLMMAGSLVVVAAAIGLLNIVTMGDRGQAIALMATLGVGLYAMAKSLSLLSGFKGSLLKASGAIAVLSFCLIMVATSIGVLNLMTLGNPWAAVAGGLVLAGMMVVMAHTLSKLGNTTRQLPNATAGMKTMTMCLLAIAGSIGVLSIIAGFNPGAMLVAVGSLALMLGALAGALVLVGRQGGQIAAATPAIWNMTLAIAAIGAAISAMMLFSGGNLGAMAVAAVSLAGTLILMAAALKILGTTAAQADAAAGAMIVMSGALLIMVAAISLLGSMDVPQLVQGFIALVAALVVLGVAAASVTFLSGAFLTLDAVILLLGIGLLTIAGAFYVFVEAIAELAQVAPEAFDRIVESKDKMIAAFYAMGEAVAASIQGFFAALIGGVNQGMSDTAGAVNANSSAIGMAAVEVGKALVNGLIMGLGGLVVGVGAAIVDGVGSAINSVSGIVAENGGAMSYEMAQSMAEHPEWYQSAGQDSAESYSEGIEESDAPAEAGQDSAESYSEGIEESDAPAEAGEEIAVQVDEAAQQKAEETDSSQILAKLFEGMDLPPEIQEQFAAMFDAEKFGDLGLDLGNAIPGNVLTGASASPIDPSTLMSGMNLTTASFDGNAKEVGTGIGNSVNSGAAETMADTSPVEAAVSAQVQAIAAHQDEYQSTGNESGRAYGTGVSDSINKANVSTAVAANVAKLSEAIQPAGAMGNRVGTAYSEGQYQGISALATLVAHASKSNINQAASNTDGESSGLAVGAAFGQGMANGIDSKQSAVSSAATRLVKNALSAAKKEADSHSPSRKMIEQGEWFGEGYAIGIQSTMGLVSMRAEEMVGAGLESARTSMSALDELVSAIDWDEQPVIRPVLDLTDFRAGLRTMDNLDLSAPTAHAVWAERVYSAPDDPVFGIQNGSNRPNIEVHLDWHAGTSANQMAMLLAQAIEDQNLLEA